MTRWLLVHPPLLGPAVLGPLAGALRRCGDYVALPDLRAAVDPAQGWPARWRDAAAAAGPADAVLGFSGAGVTLPAVALAVGARRVVWVDALVPAPSGATEADEEIRGLVAGMVRGARIPDWTTWWGPGALDELVPDERVRAAVRAEGHELPADFYDVAVPVPEGWPEDGARYVQLSAAYDSAAAEARARGWPVTGDGGGHHLDVATSPERVVERLR
ncbi:hypothetical protein SAMN05660748_3278 [Blastococcus aggregatus]|uniref:Alpha/beta hydrolase family protein n=1 Tax=Blastococcus aggregatus TaxID=38502 RepID=A0A285VAB7_9ACTN|nr:hypothetical protein [Blastococcus aggregatus]SOC50528.1 hypothetical protein SAMN05660748_3278 [Blastococcus aggregatus]